MKKLFIIVTLLCVFGCQRVNKALVFEPLTNDETTMKFVRTMYDHTFYTKIDLSDPVNNRFEDLKVQEEYENLVNTNNDKFMANINDILKELPSLKELDVDMPPNKDMLFRIEFDEVLVIVFNEVIALVKEKETTYILEANEQVKTNAEALSKLIVTYEEELDSFAAKYIK